MNKLKLQRIYLAGPIDDAADYGRGWRDKIAQVLWDMNCGVFNPTNKPIDLINEDKEFVERVNKIKRSGDFAEVERIMKKVATTDLSLVDRSDIVIAYLDNDVQMTGTIHEIVLAASQKKPCLIMCEQGATEIKNWLFGIGLDYNLFFSSWDDLIQYLHEIDSGEIQELSDDWKFIDYNRVFDEHTRSNAVLPGIS